MNDTDALEKMTAERNEMRDILSEVCAFLSVGSGDENTTAESFRERIKDGFDILFSPFREIQQRMNEAAKSCILSAVVAERDALKTEIQSLIERLAEK